MKGKYDICFTRGSLGNKKNHHSSRNCKLAKEFDNDDDFNIIKSADAINKDGDETSDIDSYNDSVPVLRRSQYLRRPPQRFDDS